MSAAVEGPASASAATSRVAELQQMIAQVEAGSTAATAVGGTTAGSGGFGAQLSAATAASGQGTSGPAGASASSLAGTTPSSLTATNPATGTPVNPSVPFAAQINASAARNGIDPSLLAGLIKAESNFDPTVGSGAGAQGLTELMPGTARSAGVIDPHNPTESIEGGARVLREALDKFGGNVELALAAYNAGAGAVERYNGIPPYPETQTYVPRVLGFAAEFRQGATR